MTLSRCEYLSLPVVSDFIDYFSEIIDGAPVRHEFVIRDRKLPVDDARILLPKFIISSLEEAFNGYWWNRGGYQDNYEKLRGVQNVVRDAIAKEDCRESAPLALNALCEVLKWGAGGTGQKLYTSNKAWAVARLDTLVESLRMGRVEMTSDFPNINTFKQARVYARMNAGFTKYYALACDDVLIYDGRVGAALGLLVRKFCGYRKIDAVPDVLAFNWGAQNGKNPLNRNPSCDGYVFQRLPVEGPIWALWNIRANWIVNAARARSHAIWAVQPDGLRRIEAALFVVGYSMPKE